MRDASGTTRRGAAGETTVKFASFPDNSSAPINRQREPSSQLHPATVTRCRCSGLWEKSQAGGYPSTLPGGPPREAISAEKPLPAALATLS